jgi:hypothetical protein
VQRLAVIAKLRPGSAERAAELIAGGPPFDPRAAGFERHTVFLAPDEVVFVFEGSSLGPLITLLTESADPSVLGAWEEILDGIPRVAAQAYSWDRPPEAHVPGF